MVPSPTPPPPHPWPDIQEAFLQSLPDAVRDAGKKALDTWLAALQDEIGAPIVAILQESMVKERHFSLPEKATMLRSALLSYEATSEFNGKPLEVPPLYTSAAESLREACRPFVGKGTPIEKPVEKEEGDVSHFITFAKLQQFFPRKGAAAAENSRSTLSWRDLLAGPKFRMEPEIVNRLQGDKWPYFSTLADWVDSQSVSGSALAAQIRDLLGCPHFDGQELVEFRIANEVARAECFTKPTFADAEAYPPFLPSAEDDDYGYARDLGSERGRGGPEIWHRCLLAQSHAARLLEAPSRPIPSELWRGFGTKKN